MNREYSEHRIGRWHGPKCPAATWMSPEMQARRKDIFLAEEGWSIYGQGRYNDENPDTGAYLFVRKNEEGDVLQLRVLDRSVKVPLLLPATDPSSLLASGAFIGYSGEYTVADLVRQSDVHIADQFDSYEDIRDMITQ